MTVRMEGRDAGITRDVSPSGIFFETGEEMTPGAPIRFALSFDNPAGNLLLHCAAEVVRVERSDGKVGVAAKIIESRMERINATGAMGIAA